MEDYKVLPAKFPTASHSIYPVEMATATRENSAKTCNYFKALSFSLQDSFTFED
jgi:hypothetical protein